MSGGKFSSSSVWEPIKVEIDGHRGCAISPYLEQNEIPSLVSFLTKGAAEKKIRIAFVDLVLTDKIFNLISLLRELGVEIYLFDHHLDWAIEDRINNFNKDKNLPKIRTFLAERQEVQSCAYLLYSGEFIEKQIDAVCFHNDGDGVISFLYGSGYKEVYPEMIEDSIIMDQGPQKNKSLSVNGRLIINAYYGKLAHPVARADRHREQLKIELPKLIGAICHPDRQESRAYRTEMNKLSCNSRETLRCLVRRKAKYMVGQVAYFDIRREIVNGQAVDIGTVTQVVHKVQPQTRLYCYTDVHFFNGRCRDVVNVRLDYRYNDVDLRDYLPSGCTYMPRYFRSRIFVAQEDWPEFLRNWQEAQRVLTET